jgi:hypothetical protein
VEQLREIFLLLLAAAAAPQTVAPAVAQVVY